MESLLGFLLLLGLGGWYLKRKKSKSSSHASLSSSDVVAPELRKNYEKKLRDEGVIGGSATESAHGYEEAFKRVIANIQLDSGTKKELYTALWSNERGNVAQNYLLPGKWQWPEFDKWKQIFNEKEEYPYMWQKYPEIYMNDFDNLSLYGIYDMLLVKDLKALLKENDIIFQNGVKKDDLIELAVKNIDLAKLRDNYPEIYTRLKSDFENRVNDGKCAILEHTIMMLGYHLRDYYTNKNIKLDTSLACPVEKRYAKGHGQLNEYNLPPFFPGDRTGVSYKIKKH